MERTSTGTELMDKLLEGGYENDIITALYGPGGSGKTNLCIIAACSLAKKGKKAVYIDTEGISTERIKQIEPEYRKIAERIIFIKPASLHEQRRWLESLRKEADGKLGIIIVDTIAMPYRMEANQVQEVGVVNKELGLHTAYLAEIARTKKIPVLLTNQVYSDFETKDKINMVGGEIVKYASKCLIELQNLNSKRRAVVRKHRSIKEGKEAFFEIIEEGIRESKPERGFRLF